jgi:CheY-like chemotaxis protein
MNVLVVEDDPDTRAGMAKVLLAAGCTVTEAEDGLAQGALGRSIRLFGGNPF